MYALYAKEYQMRKQIIATAAVLKWSDSSVNNGPDVSIMPIKRQMKQRVTSSLFRLHVCSPLVCILLVCIFDRDKALFPTKTGNRTLW